jgi:hypothetical protein
MFDYIVQAGIIRLQEITKKTLQVSTHSSSTPHALNSYYQGVLVPEMTTTRRSSAAVSEMTSLSTNVITPSW